MELFSLLIGIGASLGLLQVSRRAPSGQEFRWTFTGLLVLLSAFIGARLNYVLLHLSYYARDPLSAWRFWEGGLSWPGALILAILAAFLSALILRTSLAAAAGWPLVAHDTNALVFRVVVAATVVSASIAPFVFAPAPSEPPLRCPFPLHNLFLLGIRNVLWVFRLVGAWWLVDGLIRLLR